MQEAEALSTITRYVPDPRPGSTVLVEILQGTARDSCHRKAHEKTARGPFPVFRVCLRRYCSGKLTRSCTVSRPGFTLSIPAFER